VLKVKVFRPKC